jgi:nucleoid-associated protein YgaU
MGLFSFIKGAGAKLFNRKKTEEAVAVEDNRSPEEIKIEALKGEISRLGLPVNDLYIDLAEHVTVTGITDTNANREKIILALGNVEGIASVGDMISVTNPEPESTFHEVKKGDTLSKISRDVYGDPMKYNAIFEANQPMLSHPDKIYPGQILRIPPQNMA